MIRLGLNIDHVATLRQVRYASYANGRGGCIEPDPVAYAVEAQRCGVDGITVHPREDRRHIQPDDVRWLKACLQVPLNMEMAANAAMQAFAREIRPATVCLVPEKREEITTEGGLDLRPNFGFIRELVADLGSTGVRTSLFVDADPGQIELAARSGATFVELHTGAFANAFGTDAQSAEWDRLVGAAEQAQQAGLIVNLGHGINYTNITTLRRIPCIHEMNIGHSIISRAVFDGLRCAVSSMKALMNP